MLYREDIKDALARVDIREIETAFRALVDYPNEDEVDAPSEDLLQSVCLYLANDASMMPDGTVQVIKDLGAKSSPPVTLDGRTYADGSKAVLAAMIWFAIRLNQPTVESYSDRD